MSVDNLAHIKVKSLGTAHDFSELDDYLRPDRYVGVFVEDKERYIDTRFGLSRSILCCEIKEESEFRDETVRVYSVRFQNSDYQTQTKAFEALKAHFRQKSFDIEECGLEKRLKTKKIPGRLKRILHKATDLF